MYNDNLMILIPKEMKEQIKEKAKSEYKTVSDYVRNLIVKDLEENKWKEVIIDYGSNFKIISTRYI